MRLFGAIIVGGLLALSALPASAGNAITGTAATGATDISSQVRIETGRGGIGVEVGDRHHRWESRRHRHHRHESRRGRGRHCETVRVTRDTPRGRVTRTERRCR